MDSDSFAQHGLSADDLPTSLILGTANISRCRNGYERHFIEVKRLKRPGKPQDKAPLVWFTPSWADGSMAKPIADHKNQVF